MRFIDPRLPRHLDGWRSPRLGIDMPIVSYGDRGRPLLLFPTAAADYLENERFYLIESIESLILAGEWRVFSIESINRYAWMDRSVPIPEAARRQSLYSAYIEDEVVPHIRRAVGDPAARIAAAGASFGAFHAANAFFRRSDLFETLIAMSGFFDLSIDYLRGYSDDNVYFNNPAWYLQRLAGDSLERLRGDSRIVIVSGQGDYEAPHRSRELSGLLTEKEIPHELDLWGSDMRHDWPTWRRMLPYHLERLTG